MKRVKNQLSDLAKFNIRARKLPLLLELIKKECNDYGSCAFINEFFVDEGYAESMKEAAALIFTLKSLGVIELSYDISECGGIVLCRYIDIVNQNK